MHFTWCPGDTNLTLWSQLYGKEITITPPKSIRWLGFHLDQKLLFHHHVDLLTKKGHTTIKGLQVLGNTIEGISPSNLRLLYKIVVIPAIMYGSQLWFNPNKPNRKLVKKLESVQHRALKQIAGAFWDSQEEALQLLMYVPPITTTLHKLYRSAALRIPQLPISSKITWQLPISYLPQELPLEQRIILPKHIPFPQPLAKDVRKNSPSALSHMVTTYSKHTERAKPFHSQNTPHSF